MFCEKCGNELMDEAVVCTKCGCLIQHNKHKIANRRQKNKQGDSCAFFSWSSVILALCSILSSIFNFILNEGCFNIYIYYLHRVTLLFASASICGLLSIYALKKNPDAISILGLIMSGIAFAMQIVLIILYSVVRY